MKIFLFVSEPTTELQDEIAKRLDEEFIFMVDSVHREDTYWFKKNFSDIPHRCYYPYREMSKWYSCTVDKINEDRIPVFIVCFQQGEVILDQDWDEITWYFYELVKGIRGPNAPPVQEEPKRVYSENVIQLLNRCKKNPQLPETKSELLGVAKEDANIFYQFREASFAVQNVVLAEIRRPFTSAPYTIVLRNFLEDGYLYLFSSIFITNTWGTVWNYLGMDGEFDLDKLLRTHTVRCHPGVGNVPMCEPEVYRKSLEETAAVLRNKAIGFEIVETGKRRASCFEIIGDEAKLVTKRIKFEDEGDTEDEELVLI